jgi:nucleotide-binding universal stress UspA family protein
MSTAGGATGMPRIVVGVDGSASAEAALRWAADEARLRGARLEIVHAWQVPWVGVPGVSPPYPDEEFERPARAIIDAAIASLPAGGRPVDIESKTLKDHPAAALIDASEGATLVVVGSHGHGGFVGTLLGSVSHRVATHAHCPVVIVRPMRGRSEAED